MGFRMRKSIRVAKGVRLNLSKSGVGVSVGGEHGRISVHSSGRRTVTVPTGIPGVTYVDSRSAGSNRSSSARRPAAPSNAAPESKRPGLFAPRGEKALYEAVAELDVDALEAVGRRHRDYRVLAYSLAGLLSLNDDPQRARQLLTEVFASGEDPATHPFTLAYLSGTQLTLSIAPGVEAELPPGRDAVGLALAELHQAAGDLTAAIAAVEALEPTSYAAVSLAELYCQAGRFQDAVELTDGIANEDDLTALLLVYRGVSLRESGYFDAAADVFQKVIHTSPAIRWLVHYERAPLFER